jgi:Protein of unknown function (DUF3551)
MSMARTIAYHRPGLEPARIPMTVARRAPLWMVLALALGLTAPAQAQTYNPRYPVCLQTYGIDGGAIECIYTSLEQCNMTASGRAAQCLENPYYARTPAPPPGRVYRRARQ